MSGPLDRPPSPDPDDLDRPNQERENPPEEAQPSTPWSSTDPWQESSREQQGWDVWPPVAPPPDDYYVEPGPSQDLWTESWDDEAASTLPRAGYEPASTEPASDEPAPYEPAVDEPEPYETPPYAPVSDSLDAPAASPEAPEAEVAEATEPVAPEEPAPIRHPDPIPAPVLPDWLAEPLPPAPEAGNVSGDVPTSEEPEPPSWLDAGPAAGLPPFLDVDVDVDADLETPPVAGSARSLEPEPEPEPEPESQPEAADTPAPLPPEPGPELQVAPEPEVGPERELEPDAVDSAGPSERWVGWDQDSTVAIADEAPDDAEAAPPATFEPEVEPAVEPEVEPAAEAETAPEVETEPAAAIETEDGWQPAEWSDLDESTRVLPTSWTPPPAPPVAEPDPDAELAPVAGDVRTSLGEGPETDAEAEEDSTTAEQAVPWLIGLILLLAGMVIVLLALIFAGDQSLGGPSPQPSPSAAGVLPSPTTAPTSTPASSESASAPPSPTPLPVPDWGPLEMVYQGRAAALAPIYLLVHDFTTEDEAEVLAQDPAIDVRRFAWAPDGTVGAGLLADVLVSIEPGESKRNFGEGLMTVSFGADTSMVYAVRITADGANDVATVLEIDFLSGDSSELASVTYPRPTIGSEAALAEAQFTDEGGTVRLFWMSDGSLRLWVLGASTWTIDAESGEVTDLEAEELPILVDPENTHRIELDAADDNASTTVRYLSADGDELATATAPGLVSHVRWSRGGDRVVFTVGRSASGGGVLQDLFLWDLEAGVNPTQITNTGAAFGAEWRGASPRWEPG